MAKKPQQRHVNTKKYIRKLFRKIWNIKKVHNDSRCKAISIIIDSAFNIEDDIVGKINNV